MRPSVLICSCNSVDHQMVIYHTTDPYYGPEAYVQVHLVKRPFWHRLKYGLKYIFGYKSRYGAWDEFILDPTHATDLEKLANHLISNETQRITV